MDKGYRTRETLLFRVRDQRDEKSWDEFVEYYKNYIYVVARNMNLDHHDAEDILQRVLLKLWEKLPEFEYSEKKGTFRAFLCTIIRNMAIDLFKKKSRSQSKNSDDEKELFKKYIENISLPEIEEIAEREWKLFLANTAWEKVQKGLSEKVKQVYLMLLEGKPLEAVAEAVEIQPNTVYVYKLRVVEKIQKEIKRLERELTGEG